jgi:branched-chain amino acid transport system ATP-binding protein
MAPPLLEVEGLSKRFGGFVALDAIDLVVMPEERLGLIGPNGSGKSTLVNCLCGTLVNETGTVRFEGRDLAGMSAHRRTRLGMARSFQLPRPFASMTVADNLRVPLIYAVNTRRAPLSAVNTRRAPLYAVSTRRAPPLDDAGIAARCEELLTLVGLADRSRQYPRDLTQVDMRKLELARAMAAGPKLLFADEAMAGLSNAEVNDIVALLIRLNERGVTIILIEHIMRAVMSFSQRLVVLVSGRKIADGRPDEAIRDPQVERAYLGE